MKIKGFVCLHVESNAFLFYFNKTIKKKNRFSHAQTSIDYKIFIDLDEESSSQQFRRNLCSI